MAYVVELDEGQNDVPVTLLRSTFECAVDRSEQNINANNMLINVDIFLLPNLVDFLETERSAVVFALRWQEKAS